MTIVEQIKQRTNLKSVIAHFGGAELQGDGDTLAGWHKAHESKSKRSLHVDNAQGVWHCKGCGQGGDMFSWVGHLRRNGSYRDTDKTMFAEAMREIADFAGVEIPEHDKAGAAERRSIEEIWQIAADFYHSELTDEHRAYFHKRGYTDETIAAFKLGYAPQGPRTMLAHLVKVHKIDGDELVKSGLFLKRDNGDLEDHFQGRLMFPYLVRGRVAYFIGRITDQSPKWEHDRGMKYKKLLVNNDKHPYVSEQVSNRYFYGEDSVKLGGDLLITEGVADCLSALQAGSSCVSPVTIRFAKKDHGKILEFAERAGTVYICNDNEASNAGGDGTLATAEMLWHNGKVAKIVTLPRPAGVDKVDLNDFLSNPEQGPEAFKKLLPTAKTLLDLKVDEIAACTDDKKLMGLQKEAIALIAHVKDGYQLELWRESMPGKLKLSKKGYNAFVKNACDALSENAKLGHDDGDDGDDDKRIKNIATYLYELAVENCEVFTGSDGVAYASTTITHRDGTDHTETMKVKSMRFRQWLGQLHYSKRGSVVGKTACEEVIELLSFPSGDTRHTFLRVGGDGENTYIDLGDDKWQCVEINAQGWQVLDSAPIVFRRTAKMQPLPMPVKTNVEAALVELFKLINIAVEDRILVIAWLLAAMRHKGPYPVLTLIAEPGSAKTTTAKALKRLISPYVAETRSRPKTVEDVYVASNNDWILVYDNLSSIPLDISDAFCRLATGGGFATRELYENLEEVVIDQQQPLIINGVADIVRKGDLASRIVTVTLPTITTDNRIDESEWEQRFTDAHPRILGALLDLLSYVTAELPKVKCPLPRMADFAKLGVALDTVTDITGKTHSFAERYAESNRQGTMTVIENSPTYRPLWRFMEKAGSWEGTAASLLEELRKVSTFTEKLDLPKAGNALVKELNGIAPNLRTAQIIDIRCGRTKKGSHIALTKLSDFDRGELDNAYSATEPDTTPGF